MDVSPQEGPGGSQVGVLRARLGQLYSSPGLGLGLGEEGGGHTPRLLGAPQPDRSLSPEEGLSGKGLQAVYAWAWVPEQTH